MLYLKKQDPVSMIAGPVGSDTYRCQVLLR